MATKNTTYRKRFVCGDIHGSYLALIQVLERSGFDYDQDLLIPIGDIVDGWPDSFKVVEELLKIKNRIDIVGNHDDWFIDFIDTGIHPEGWGQGGLPTAKSYAKAAGVELKVHPRTKGYGAYRYTTYIHNLNSGDIPEEHKKFFKGMHGHYKDEDNNIFVHGGFSRALSINNTPRDFKMWDRKLFNQAMSANKSENGLKFAEEVNQVFIGHTTTMAWDTTEPILAGGKVWNIDTGAGGGGVLTIMDIDTNEFFQSDAIPTLYPDYNNIRA
tara:strand:- start:4865 stop:5674 length:810 start_codon:yes stop_codon:yes gene_type:complete